MSDCGLSYSKGVSEGISDIIYHSTGRSIICKEWEGKCGYFVKMCLITSCKRKEGKTVVCFSFEWFGSQICSHRGVLTVLVHVGWNCIVGSSHSSAPQTTNPPAVPADGSGSGLLPGSPLPGWFCSENPDGTST